MVVINTCDSLTHWSTINGVDALDTTIKKEGTSSIKTTGSGTPASIVQERYDPPGMGDWNAYDHLTFWFRTEDISDLQFRIWTGPDPNNRYIQWSRQFAQQVKAINTWYEVKLYFDDYDTQFGAFSLIFVDGLTVRVWQTNPATSFWIDYIRVDDADPVKIKIGSGAGLDYVSDDTIQADLWRDSLSGIGRWEIILENTNNKWGGDFLPDEDVEIRFDGILMMRGYVDDVVPFLEPAGVYKNQIKVLGRDYGMDLAQLYITREYPNRRADDTVNVALLMATSEIDYTSHSVAPVINFEFNRTYLADGLRDICKLVDYDFYVDDIDPDGGGPFRASLHLFAVGAGAEHTTVDLTSVPTSVTNNILRLEKGEKIGFSIKNYIELHAGGLQDNWTDLNASDWSSAAAAACGAPTDEPIIYLAGKGAIRVTATGATDLIVDLDFSGAGLYEYTSIDMSERNEGSYLCYKSYVSDAILMKACRIWLKDTANHWIEFYKSKGSANCSECTDDNQNTEWRKIVFPYGEGLEIKAAAAFISGFWHYIAPAAAFDWGHVETIRFISDRARPRAAPDYFIIDGLDIPTVEVISIEQDIPSQNAYGKRMLSVYRPDLKNQVELDAAALKQEEKYKDPLETIKITAIGQTGSVYAGQSLDVRAPSHGIPNLTKYRIVKLHHKVVRSSEDSEVPAYTFLTIYDLLKHEINPTQVMDPNRFAIYKTSIEATMRDIRDKLIRLTKVSPLSSSGGAGGGSGTGAVVPYYISGNDIVFYDAYTMLRPETTGSIDLGSAAIQFGDIWGTVKYSDLHLLDVRCPRCRKLFEMNDDIKFVVTAVESLDSGGIPYDQIRCVPIHGRCSFWERVKGWFYKLLHRRTDEETVYG